MLVAELRGALRGSRARAAPRPCSRRPARPRRRRPRARARRRSTRTAPRSLNGAVSVSRAAPSVTPGRRRDAERREPAAGALGEQRVGMAVVAALELHEQVAPGRAAREPDRAHRGLGAAVDEPHPVDARHRIDDALGELDLADGRRAERGAHRRRPARRLDDLGSCVAEQQRAPRLHEVDVAVAVGVDQVGALAALDEHGRAAHRAERPHGRVDPAGDHRARALEQVLATCVMRRRAATARRPSRGR